MFARRSTIWSTRGTRMNAMIGPVHQNTDRPVSWTRIQASTINPGTTALSNHRYRDAPSLLGDLPDCGSVTSYPCQSDSRLRYERLFNRVIAAVQTWNRAELTFATKYVECSCRSC